MNRDSFKTILASKKRGNKGLNNISQNSIVSASANQIKHASKNKSQTNFSNFYISQMESFVENNQYDNDAVKNEDRSYDLDFAKQIATIQEDCEVLSNKDVLTMVSKQYYFIFCIVCHKSWY